MSIDELRGVLGLRAFTSRNELTPGKIIQFTYDGEQKYAIVLNPEWEGKLHGLTLENVDISKFVEIRNTVGLDTDGKVLYTKFKNFKLLNNRPYRTYLLSKVSALREVYIKEEKLPK